MTRPTIQFGDAVCEPIRCNATSAEVLAFDFGALAKLIIVVCSLVAGFKLSRSNILLPLLVLAAASLMFPYWYERVENYSLARDNIEEGVRAEYVGWDEARAEMDRSRFDIQRAQNHWKGQALWAWLQLSIFPFGVGVVAAGIARRLRPR